MEIEAHQGLKKGAKVDQGQDLLEGSEVGQDLQGLDHVERTKAGQEPVCRSGVGQG